MPNDIGMLRAKLRKSLEAIGKNNGHACPPTKSNIDPTLHELYVTAEAMSYFKARHDKARDAALTVAFDAGELETAVERVKKNLEGESVIAAEGELYSMLVDIAKPASRLDQTKLRSMLMVKHKMSAKQVDTLLKECSDLATPAKRVKIVGR